MARFPVNGQLPRRRVSAASIAAAAAAMSALAACYYLIVAPSWPIGAGLHAVLLPEVPDTIDQSHALPTVERLHRSNRKSALDEPWQADFAFAVTTGALTAQRRVPLQQLTMFAYSIRNFVLIGAGADPGRSADLPIVDVATPVRQRLEALHAELKRKAATSTSAAGSTESSSQTAGEGQAAGHQLAALQGPTGTGAQDAAAAAAPAEQESPRRRLLLGLQQHPLWRAWLSRGASSALVRHGGQAQRPRHSQRQQHRRKRGRQLHRAAQRRLQTSQWTVRDGHPTAQPLWSTGARAQQRRLRWVSTDGAGRAMNRYKGVPGLQALYQAFPDAKWYIMIDDDTYFFMHNFRDFIANWDPDAIHYFGNTMKYEAATNPHTGEQFQLGHFAHGGEGIIVSRAAMRRFADMYDQCVDRVLESGFGIYGDTQIALCMRLAGVEYNKTALLFNHFLINDPPGLTTDDQAGRQWPLQGPCSRPFSVHHLLPEHMQALYDAESAAPGLRPTYEDVWRAIRRNFVTKALERTLRVSDVWIVGDPAHVTQTDSADACEAACEARTGGVAWQWGDDGGQSCKLHDRWHQVQALEEARKGQVVCGVLLHRFVCNLTASPGSVPA